MPLVDDPLPGMNASFFYTFGKTHNDFYILLHLLVDDPLPGMKCPFEDIFGKIDMIWSTTNIKYLCGIVK